MVMAGDKDKKTESDKDETDNRPVPRSPLTEMWDDTKTTRDKDSYKEKERRKDSDDD